MKLRFILKGKAYVLSRKEIERKMQEIDPEIIASYYIVINKKKYPLKQVLGDSLGLSRLEFTSVDAFNILRRLGFKIERKNE